MISISRSANFGAVLQDAQRQGYAETPPDLDIDGWDSQHKIGILASLAHGFWVSPKKIHVEGIRNLTALDIKFAGQLGYTIKLLGIVKKAEGRREKAEGKARVQVSVYPALVLPVLVRSSPPKYTSDALRAKLQGTVEVEAVVGVDGTVSRARVTKSLDTQLGLDESAVDAAKSWVFEAGRLNGQPVPVVVSLKVEFRIR